MGSEHEQFISEEDEVKRIREKKLKELIELKEKKHVMAAEPVHVKDSNFNKIVSKNSLALIDFWAEWCPPCKIIAPVVEELAREYAGKVLVGKLNVDENPATAERFQVHSIPTLLIIKNGEEVDRIVGSCPKNQIEAHLKKHLK